jgi:hypothetical protein
MVLVGFDWLREVAYLNVIEKVCNTITVTL